MNIQIIGDNFNVSPSVKYNVEEKIGARLEKLLTTFDPEMKTTLVRIKKDKFGMFFVNLDMNLPGKGHIYAETEHKILESAIIDVSQEAEKQIKKYREKISGYSLG